MSRISAARVQGDQPQRRLGLRLRIQLRRPRWYRVKARHLQSQRNPRAPAAAGRISGARAAGRGLPAGTEVRRRIAADRRHRSGRAIAPCGTARRASTASPSWRAAMRRCCAGRPARRPRRQPQPLHRGRGRRRRRRLDLSAQRQSRRHREVRLQAAVDGAARGARRDLLAEERPVVLAGDYNVIPEDRDTFSRRAMANDALFQPESQRAFRRMVNQGWTDALRALHPGRAEALHLLGLSGRRVARDAGFRIDHLLCSPQAADRLRGADVDKWARAEEKASDHAPTWRLEPVGIGLPQPPRAIATGACRKSDSRD